jgi:serine/threonine protein kinase
MDEYHLAEQVGEGSFGRVFKGRRRYTSQTVAIKLMQKHGKSEKDMRNLRQVRPRARCWALGRILWREPAQMPLGRRGAAVAQMQ